MDFKTTFFILAILMLWPTTRRIILRLLEKWTGFKFIEPDTFTEKARKKSKGIVESADQTVITRCDKAMGSVMDAGNIDVACRVVTYKDIEGRDKFLCTVNTLGAHIKLPVEQITNIKQAADSKQFTDKVLTFNAALKTGGQIRLHSGSYEVVKKYAQNEGENELFTLAVAIGFMDLSEIVLRQIPELEKIETSWELGNQDEWNMFLEYKAHSRLLKYYDENE